MATVVIFYLFRNSGHHSAAKAVDAALHTLDPSIHTVLMDPLEFMHPQISRAVWRNLVFMLQQTPELWDALYDSRPIDSIYRTMQGLIHRSSDTFIRAFRALKPNAVVCTQSYPLGLIRELRQDLGLSVPLFGVITDLRVHRLWMHGQDIAYVVPNTSSADRLSSFGVPKDRIRVFGIPIGHGFVPASLPAGRPGSRRVLVMGGSQGMGPRFRTIRALDRSEASFTIDIVTGTNRMLRNRLAGRRGSFHHPVRLRGFVKNVPALMHRADLLISKAGGLTCAEAMSAGLPMLIIHPLPGQETGNTEELVGRGAALRVPADQDVAPVVTALFRNPELLVMMRQRAMELARPAAAFQIADDVLRAAAQHALTGMALT